MMNGKRISILALVLALLLTTSVTALAQGAGPMGDEQAQGIAPQDGNGYRRGWTDKDGEFVHRGMNFLDEDMDSVCDNFVDEDGDGLCDHCPQYGSQQMSRRNAQSQGDAATNGAMRRGNGGQDGHNGRR